MKLKLKEFILENEKGGKVTISFDDSFSPEDIVQVLEKLQDKKPVVEEKSNSPSVATLEFSEDYESLTIREKLELIVNQIKYGWFTSDHIRELYQFHFHEEIKPSTVSTYLARMFNENILERRGSRAKREYRLAETQFPSLEYIKEVQK
ncbi:MAG: hypothetical protein ACTSYB_18245 [Candidatus Helarchaeota archaeon]